MKTIVLFVAGLSVFAVGCSKKPVVGSNSNGTTQVQAPVAAVTPAKQAPQAPAAKQTPTQTVAATPTAAPAKRLTPQQRQDLNALLQKLADAFFDYDKATIRPDAQTALGDNVSVIRGIMADYPAEKLLIEGYADQRGSSEYNLALGDRRSRAAQEFLSSRGIPQAQLEVVSFGKERLACTDDTEACYQKNRRIHITVAP